MADVLQPRKPTLEQRLLIASGMGGIGKTQLSIGYARRYRICYTSVFWLNVTSEQTLKASLRSVANRLLTEQELNSSNEESMVRAVLRWLSLANYKEWLLILDNQDDEHAYDYREYLPHSAHGSVLVTTRLPDQLAGQRIQQIRVPSLSDPNKGARIPKSRSLKKDVEQDPDAHRLVDRLAGPPLALAAAGAYLRRQL